MAFAPLHGPHRRSGAATLRLASCVLAVCTAVAPTAGEVVPDRPEAREQQRRHRRSQHQALQTAVQSLPRLDAAEVGEVLAFRLTQGTLAVAVPQPEWVTRRGGQFRVELAAMPGPAHVQLANVPAFHRPGRQPGTALPVGSLQAVTFLHRGMPDPGTLTTLAVQSGPGSFSLTHTTESDDGLEAVRLAEQQNLDLPGGGTAQLWVDSHGGGRVRPVSLHVVAENFSALVRENPREVDAHLRPLFARLAQEPVFAPDPHVAWQALAEYWPPDDAVGRLVAGLLPDFDHPSYRVRERALDRLVSFGRPAAAVLLRHDRAGFSASRHLMVDRALAGYGQIPPAEAARLRNDVGFVLDCLYSDDPTIRSAAVRHLRKLTGRANLGFDPDAPAGAERSAAIRELRNALLQEPTPTSKPGHSNGRGWPSPGPAHGNRHRTGRSRRQPPCPPPST